MHYIWAHRMNGDGRHLVTNEGVDVDVLHTGSYNSDAGPDFFNAKLRIGDNVWCGNVEMHIKASDWMRHGHDRDKLYDSVILHVVVEDDMTICRTNGERIAQCVLPIPQEVQMLMQELLSQPVGKLPCLDKLGQVAEEDLSQWLERMARERMYHKCLRIDSLRRMYADSWEEVCYITLARSLGFGLNSDAMERLARCTPLKMLQKHSAQMVQIEALLFGQAGLLDADTAREDVYLRRLLSEYAFLKNKFALTGMDASAWRMFRTRPQGFPHRRIATLARLISGGFNLFSRIRECSEVDELRRLFEIELDGYWGEHFSFSHVSQVRAKALSRDSINSILINTVAPLLFSYGSYLKQEPQRRRAVELLHSLPAECNNVVKTFTGVGMKIKDSLQSQAAMNLRREYCEQHKCLKCQIGVDLLLSALKQK